MKLIDDDTYKVYIYGHDHPPPHCHVVWPDGSTSVVSLLEMEVIVGKQINKQIRALIRDHWETLCDKWDELNPQKHEK